MKFHRLCDVRVGECEEGGRMKRKTFLTTRVIHEDVLTSYEVDLHAFIRVAGRGSTVTGSDSQLAADGLIAVEK